MAAKQKIKLSPETIAVLKNFASINKSILIQPGQQLTTVSPSKSVAAKATVEENFETEFGIFDLPRFLSTLSLFTDPELQISSDKIVIKEGDRKIQYTCSPAKTILTIPEASYDKLEKMTTTKSGVKFALTDEAFQGLTKALSILKLPEFKFAGDGTKITVQAVDSETPSTDLYETTVVDSDATFEALFRAENLRFLPRDYEVSFGEGASIAKFGSTNISYYVSAESRR